MTPSWLDPLQRHLSTALDQQRLGHAPLLTGPVGVGKNWLGAWLVRRILCLQPKEQAPCGQCRACELLSCGSHPDYFNVGIPEDKKEIPIDSVRELCASLQLTPRVGPRRVGLIEPAEAMNINAANALLKTLEEPFGDAFLIMVSHQPGRLPATIRSRCQHVPVRPPESGVALEWLVSSCPDQPSELLDEALILSAGAPLAARELLEGDGMAFGREVLDGLLGIAQGRPTTSVMGEHWQASAASTWRWLAVWVGVMMQHAQGIESGRLGKAGHLVASLDARELGRLWEQALRGRALARTSARQDLLLGKWLLEWSALSHSGS